MKGIAMGNSNVFLPSSGSPLTLWSKSESSSNRTRTIQTKTLAVFRLADNWFGVDIAQIERVVPIDYFTRLTSNCGAIIGTVGIENRLISVIDLRSVLGIGHSQPESHSTILVIRVQPDGVSHFGSRKAHPQITQIRGESRVRWVSESAKSAKSADEKKEKYEIGILADEFVDVFFVPASQILQYLENDDPGFEQVIAGECVCGDRTISVVNVAGVIGVLNSAGVAVPA
jgi:chemotaxis signal transduction protein